MYLSTGAGAATPVRRASPFPTTCDRGVNRVSSRLPLPASCWIRIYALLIAYNVPAVVAAARDTPGRRLLFARNTHTPDPHSLYLD
jgi:hypothetical protein